MRSQLHVYARAGAMPTVEAVREQLVQAGGRIALAPDVAELRGKVAATVDGKPIMFQVLWVEHDADQRASYKELLDAKADPEGFEALTTAEVDYTFGYDPDDARENIAVQTIAQIVAHGARGWLIDTRTKLVKRFAPRPRQPQRFELGGADGDEIRLLRAPDSGFSIALAGTPHIAPTPKTNAIYDVVIALDELRAFYGFRLDPVATPADPGKVAVDIAIACRDNRAVDKTAQPTGLSITPEGVVGGAQIMYARRDVEVPTMESVVVMHYPREGGLWRLVHSTWFANKDVVTLQWSHLRASYLDQYAWGGKPREVPSLWPPSEMTRPSANLQLTDAAMRAGDAMAAQIGHLSAEQMLALHEKLRQYCHSHYPPLAPVPELLRDTIRDQLRAVGPAQAVEAMLATLDSCKTRHDLRGWTLQCTYALGTRSELRPPPAE